MYLHTCIHTYIVCTYIHPYKYKFLHASLHIYAHTSIILSIYVDDVHMYILIHILSKIKDINYILQ